MVPEDTVQMCVACNLPWLDLDNQVAPQAGFSTGKLSQKEKLSSHFKV